MSAYAANDEDLEKKFRAGDIVVVEQTTNEMVHKLKDAAGIITETGDRYSHAAVVGMTLKSRSSHLQEMRPESSSLEHL